MYLFRHISQIEALAWCRIILNVGTGIGSILDIKPILIVCHVIHTGWQGFHFLLEIIRAEGEIQRQELRKPGAVQISWGAIAKNRLRCHRSIASTPTEG